MAEHIILNNHPDALVVRTSAFFSPWDIYNFVYHVRKSLAQDERIKVAKDLIISPTYVPDLVNTALDLLIDKESGIWHLANTGALSWADFALIIADEFELDSSMIEKVSASELNYMAKRPAYSVLSSEKGHFLPPLENAIERYVHEEKMEKRKVA